MSRTSVFVVQHVAREDALDEDVKLIGVYATKVEANAAVLRLKDQPGFCDFADTFSIDEYRLNEDHWTDGFVTVH